MKKIISHILLLILSIIFLSGCISLQNINRIDSKKEYKQPLSEVLLLSNSGKEKIQYKIGTSLDYCKKRLKKFARFIGYKNNIHSQLLARDIKLSYFNKVDKPKRLLMLSTGKLYRCNSEVQDVKISLYDSESISKNWTKETKTGVKIKNLMKLTSSNDNIIYQKIYSLDMTNKEQNILKLSSKIMLDFEKLGLIPQKIKTIQQVEEELKAKRKKR